MTLELALSGTAIGMAGGTLALVWRQAYRQGQIDLMVKTMWDATIRRGKVEALERGWGQMNSPLTLTATGLEIVMPFLDIFLPIYTDMVKRKLSERDMYVELESKMGDFIVEKICIPNRITKYACLVLIMTTCESESSRG